MTPWQRLLGSLAAAVGLLLNATLALADNAPPLAPASGVAVEDFIYVDTSGEPTDQAAAHRQRLQSFMMQLRRDFAVDPRFRLVAVSCGASCNPGDAATPALTSAASEAGARLLVMGGIHKMSTLIQLAKVTVIDLAADRVVLDRFFTFRGDDDEAWRRAQIFLSREVRAALVADQPKPAQSTTKEGFQ